MFEASLPWLALLCLFGGKPSFSVCRMLSAAVLRAATVPAGIKVHRAHGIRHVACVRKQVQVLLTGLPVLLPFFTSPTQGTVQLPSSFSWLMETESGQELQVQHRCLFWSQVGQIACWIWSKEGYSLERCYIMMANNMGFRVRQTWV